MLILGIDCSSAACSAAIVRDGNTVCADMLTMTRGHAAALLPMVAAVLKNAKVSVRKLDAIAVSTGPGSFTGLRIAMAAAKGLALAADRPLIGISCFDAVAQRARTAAGSGSFDLLLLALASKREEVFIQARDGAGSVLFQAQALTPALIGDRLGAMFKDGGIVYVSGDAAELVVPALQEPAARSRARVEIGPAEPPDARDVAALALDKMALGQAATSAYTPGLTPLYLRPPATTLGA